jgi:hypothetical protein
VNYLIECCCYHYPVLLDSICCVAGWFAVGHGGVRARRQGVMPCTSCRSCRKTWHRNVPLALVLVASRLRASHTVHRRRVCGHRMSRHGPRCCNQACASNRLGWYRCSPSAPAALGLRPRELCIPCWLCTVCCHCSRPCKGHTSVIAPGTPRKCPSVQDIGLARRCIQNVCRQLFTSLVYAGGVDTNGEISSGARTRANGNPLNSCELLTC